MYTIQLHSNHTKYSIDLGHCHYHLMSSEKTLYIIPKGSESLDKVSAKSNPLKPQGGRVTVTSHQSPCHLTSARGCHLLTARGRITARLEVACNTAHQPRSLVSNWRLQCPQSRRGLCSINRYPGLRPCPGWQCPAQWNCSEEINNFLFYAVKRQRPFQAVLHSAHHNHTATHRLGTCVHNIHSSSVSIQQPSPPEHQTMQLCTEMQTWAHGEL